MVLVIIIALIMNDSIDSIGISGVYWTYGDAITHGPLCYDPFHAMTSFCYDFFRAMDLRALDRLNNFTGSGNYHPETHERIYNMLETVVENQRSSKRARLR